MQEIQIANTTPKVSFFSTWVSNNKDESLKKIPIRAFLHLPWLLPFFQRNGSYVSRNKEAKYMGHEFG